MQQAYTWILSVFIHLFFVYVEVVSKQFILGMRYASTSFDVTETEWYVFPFFSPDVNFDELSRCTDDYNGAMLKAVCVEAVSQKSIVSLVSNMIYVYLVKWLSPPLTLLVNLRNRTGEERRQQAWQ